MYHAELDFVVLMPAIETQNSLVYLYITAGNYGSRLFIYSKHEFPAGLQCPPPPFLEAKFPSSAFNEETK